ncbi:hypothetical protein E5347_00185 [Clostridium sartagoforme]|uniref:Uncharacterized protein n=1 Tax=Clostridium sartagoforme TaxID=84031 RepID=A0A4S2DMI6_9CLOT|nr:hypothetical protein [Clostridium sartagoforme]TGY43265.1 hypothetical protein E5347_00185 [Clostridium sartagoforme]
MYSENSNGQQEDNDLKFVPLNIREPFKNKDSSWYPEIDTSAPTLSNISNNFIMGLSVPVDNSNLEVRSFRTLDYLPRNEMKMGNPMQQVLDGQFNNNQMLEQQMNNPNTNSNNMNQNNMNPNMMNQNNMNQNNMNPNMMNQSNMNPNNMNPNMMNQNNMNQNYMNPNMMNQSNMNPNNMNPNMMNQSNMNQSNMNPNNMNPNMMNPNNMSNSSNASPMSLQEKQLSEDASFDLEYPSETPGEELFSYNNAGGCKNKDSERENTLNSNLSAVNTVSTLKTVSNTNNLSINPDNDAIVDGYSHENLDYEDFEINLIHMKLLRELNEDTTHSNFFRGESYNLLEEIDEIFNIIKNDEDIINIFKAYNMPEPIYNLAINKIIKSTLENTTYKRGE